MPILNTVQNSMVLKVLLSLAIIILGIVIGKIVGLLLRRISDKTELSKKMRASFVKLIISAIKWSIYLVFFDLAIMQLNIPALTNLVGRIIVVIPALVSSVILVALGFAIAIYLREVIEDSEVLGWRTLSLNLYYFILFVFGIYALKIALFSLDTLVSNIIVISAAVIFMISIGYLVVKKELNSHFKK